MALQKIPRTLLNTGFSDSSDATAITINSSEEVGIGTTSPSSAKLVVSGAKTQSGGAPIGCVLIADSTSLAANVGGGITFQGVYHSGGNITGLASIEAMKETATHNQYGGALVLKTREDQGSMNEAMRINSTGNVGVGTTSPSQLIHGKTSSGNAYMRIERASQSTGQVGLQIGGGTSSTDWFTYIPSSSDDLVFFGNSANRVRMLSAGGIAFGTDTAAANALDDYEEGTWTPTFVGATLSTATGSYTKIGNQVTVHFRVITTGGLPSSGTEVRVGGLPFTIGTGFGGVGGLYVGPSNVSSATGGGGTIVPYVTGGEDFIRFLNVDTGTFGYTLMGELEVSANNVITTVGTVTYTV